MANRTVVFVHSYCLNGSEVDKRLRLTSMAAEAMRTGIEMIKTGAEQILVSAAYNTWREEFQLQKEAAIKSGIEESRILAIAPIADSYDEAKRAVASAITLGASELIVIAERWHAPRSNKIFRAIAPPNLKVSMVTFKTPHFEVTAEPSAIKSLRTGTAATWILWNKLFDLLTPVILKMKG